MPLQLTWDWIILTPKLEWTLTIDCWESKYIHYICEPEPGVLGVLSVWYTRIWNVGIEWNRPLLIPTESNSKLNSYIWVMYFLLTFLRWNSKSKMYVDYTYMEDDSESPNCRLWLFSSRPFHYRHCLGFIYTCTLSKDLNTHTYRSTANIPVGGGRSARRYQLIFPVFFFLFSLCQWVGPYGSLSATAFNLPLSSAVKTSDVNCWFDKGSVRRHEGECCTVHAVRCMHNVMQAVLWVSNKVHWRRL